MMGIGPLTRVSDLEVGDEFRMPFDVDLMYEGEYVVVSEFFPDLDQHLTMTPSMGRARSMNVKGYLVTRTIALPEWAYIPCLPRPI